MAFPMESAKRARQSSSSSRAFSHTSIGVPANSPAGGSSVWPSFVLCSKTRPGVEEATIFGQAIRALVSEDDQLQDIASPGIEIRPTEPNLEDVFVTIARTKHAA